MLRKDAATDEEVDVEVEADAGGGEMVGGEMEVEFGLEG